MRWRVPAGRPPSPYRPAPAAGPVPISLCVDDGAPLVPARRPGARREAGVGYLERFCELVARHRLRGKFSVIPCPEGRGDIVRGLAGVEPGEVRAWLATLKAGLAGRFSFCPEGLTHGPAVDVRRGRWLPVDEVTWARAQTRATLAPYLACAQDLLKRAGLDSTGFTSPQEFGLAREREYQAALMTAQRRVFGRRRSWYFLHMVRGFSAKPWVAARANGSVLVSIPVTVEDDFWRAMTWRGRARRRDVEAVADGYLSRDGRGGAIRTILDRGGWPILLCHWPWLWANGTEAGLLIVEEVVRRVHRSLRGRVVWASFDRLMALTLGRRGRARGA